MIKKNFNRLLALLCTILVLFTGCGKKEDSKNSTKEKNNSIRLQMHITESLNPILATDTTVRDALFLCYEPLFRVNKNLSPKGVLATSYKISDDAMNVIITLKDSVLWHDKKPFTADDVVYTIEYIKSQSDSPYGFSSRYIEEAKALDKHSVKLTLTRPYAQIVYSLYFPIIPKHKISIEDKIIGTGPYKLEEYLHASELRLKKNKSWHGGEAQSDKIYISMTRSKEIASSSFTTGVINAVTSNSYDLSNYAISGDAKSKKYPSANYEYLAFNHNLPIFSSVFVRSAISYAIDRSDLVKSCFGGYASEANAPLHPDSNKASPSPTLVEYSVENAHELLFYEGYSLNENTGLLEDENKKTLSFTILVNEENMARINCAEEILSLLLKAGINANIKALPFDEYKTAIQNGNFDAYIGGVTLGNIRDYEFLLSKEGALNNFGYSDDYMELALSAIASSPSEDSQADALSNLEEIFYRTQPICGLVFESDVLITAKKVEGEISPLMNFPYANIVSWKIK